MPSVRKMTPEEIEGLKSPPVNERDAITALYDDLVSSLEVNQLVEVELDPGERRQTTIARLKAAAARRSPALELVFKRTRDPLVVSFYVSGPLAAEQPAPVAPAPPAPEELPDLLEDEPPAAHIIQRRDARRSDRRGDPRMGGAGRPRWASGANGAGRARRSDSDRPGAGSRSGGPGRPQGGRPQQGPGRPSGGGRPQADGRPQGGRPQQGPGRPSGGGRPQADGRPQGGRPQADGRTNRPGSARPQRSDRPFSRDNGPGRRDGSPNRPSPGGPGRRDGSPDRPSSGGPGRQRPRRRTR